RTNDRHLTRNRQPAFRRLQEAAPHPAKWLHPGHPQPHGLGIPYHRVEKMRPDCSSPVMTKYGLGDSMSNATTDTLKGLSLEALAESEHRFRELVEALPDAILVHSENKLVFVNPFCVRLLAAAGPDQLLGRDISGVNCPEYLPAIRSRIQDCYATGTASPPTESTVIACDGSSVDIEAVAIPINWNGAPAIEVVMRDIRKRKR